MKRFTTIRLRTLFLASAMIFAVVAIGFVSNSNGQDSNQGNPTILKAVQALQSSVNALASRVASISTSLTSLTNQVTTIGNQVASLATAPTVISTGLDFKPTGFSGSCNAENVGSSSVTVKMELLTIEGVVLQNPSIFIPPGTGNGVGQPRGSTPNNVWCRFTMIAGSSADIRANLDISNETTGLTAVIREAR